MRFRTIEELIAWTESGAWRALLEPTGWYRLADVPINHAADFAAWFAATGLVDQPYLHGSSPRRQIHQRVYTSTEAPAGWPVPLHCEMSYTLTPPRYVMFYCETAPDRAGSTPLADAAAITRAIPEAVAATFAERGVMNLRVLPKFRRWPYLTSWPRVYGTPDKDRVREVCQETNHQAVFTSWGDLILRNRQDAYRELLGQRLWFNQVTVFHRSFHQELDHWARHGRARAHRFYRRLVEWGSPVVAYPFDAAYGDGTPIPDEVMLAVRKAHWQAMWQDPWQARDLLMIDNWRVAHGRAPFGGKRRVLVAMGSPRPLNADAGDS